MRFQACKRRSVLCVRPLCLISSSCSYSRLLRTLRSIDGEHRPKETHRCATISEQCLGKVIEVHNFHPDTIKITYGILFILSCMADGRSNETELIAGMQFSGRSSDRWRPPGTDLFRVSCSLSEKGPSRRPDPFWAN